MNPPQNPGFVGAIPTFFNPCPYSNSKACSQLPGETMTLGDIQRYTAANNLFMFVVGFAPPFHIYTSQKSFLIQRSQCLAQLTILSEISSQVSSRMIVDPRVFRVFYEYLYTKTILPDQTQGFDTDQVTQLIQLSVTYCLDEISQIIDQLIAFHTVYKLRVVARQLQSVPTQIQNKIADYIKNVNKNAEALIQTKEFLFLSRQSLKDFLESDDLCCGEMNLFSAVIRWAKSIETKSSTPEQQKLLKSYRNLRLRFKDVFDLIRFPLLSPADIADTIRPLQILSEQEYLDLLTYVCASPGKKPPHCGTFCVRPRAKVVNEEEEVTIVYASPARKYNNGHQNGGLVAVANSPANATNSVVTDTPNSSRTEVPDAVDVEVMDLTVSPTLKDDDGHPCAESDANVSTDATNIADPNDSSQTMAHDEAELMVCDVSLNMEANEIEEVQEDDTGSADITDLAHTTDSSSPSSVNRDFMIQDSSCDETIITAASWFDFLHGIADNRSKITKIVGKVSMESMTVPRIPGLPSEILIPNLTSVHLDLVLPLSRDEELRKKQFTLFAKSFDLEPYIFFKKTETPQPDSYISFELVIQGVKFFKLDPSKGDLLIRGNSEDLLQSRPILGHLNFLALVDSTLPSNPFPCDNFRKVILWDLLGGSLSGIGTFLQNFTHLEELTCWINPPIDSLLKEDDVVFKRICFDLSLQLGPCRNLRRLALYQHGLTLPPAAAPSSLGRVRVRMENLTELYTVFCTFIGETVLENFSQIFPSLKRLGIHACLAQAGGSSSPDGKSVASIPLTFLMEVLKIGGISWIHLGGVGVPDAQEGNGVDRDKTLEVFKFLIDAGMDLFSSLDCVNNKKKCVNIFLEKKEGEEWTGVALDDFAVETLLEFVFKHFNLNRIARDVKSLWY